MANGPFLNWVKALTGIAIPVVLLLVGNSFSNAIKEKELRLQYVELAVQILQQEASDENQNIRNWAINVINNYSNIKIDQATKTELKKFRIQLPRQFQPIIMDSRTLDTVKKMYPELKRK